jgi:hypothetical protein
MRSSRIVSLTLSAYVFLGAATAAHATVDLTGRWVLDINFFGTQFSDVWTITQTGTALTQSPPSSGQAGPRTGMIDLSTDSFTLADLMNCTPAIGPSACTFSGTAAADGLTFTGTLNCVAPTPTECADGPASVTATRTTITCGDGVVDQGEQCDDGPANGAPDSCCSLACQFIPAGTSCDPSSNVCMTHDVCDGADHCVAGGPPLSCDPCSACEPASGSCVPSPATSCRASTLSGAAKIVLKTKGPLLSWKWLHGQATSAGDFGNPVATDSYTLCLYDESVGGGATTRLELAIPPGTAWRTKPAGFVYKDKLGSASGVTAGLLKAGADGKARVTLKAIGPHLHLPSLPPVLPVTVQLRSHGLCWGAVYGVGGLKKGTSSEFIATSSPSAAFLEESELAPSVGAGVPLVPLPR